MEFSSITLLVKVHNKILDKIVMESLQKKRMLLIDKLSYEFEKKKSR